LVSACPGWENVMESDHLVKQMLLLGLLFIAAAVLWNTPILVPVKLFVVLLHEMSHGLAAVLFGGRIVEIQISPDIGGYCKYTIPQGWFSQFCIASAGYLGSMFWGGIILLLAAGIRKDRFISLGIGIITLGLTYFVIKSGELFGIVFTFVFALFMILSFKFLKDGFHDTMLKFLGLTSCLYVILDIKNDLIDRSGIGSDADTISQMTGIPSIIVGIAWILIALALLVVFLRLSFRISRKSSPKNAISQMEKS